MRKEDTYTLLGTLFSDTLAWVSGKRKSPKVLNLRTFLIFSVFIRRCGRDSNPRPQAWQACILTSWTTAPFLFMHQTTAVVLNCECKCRTFFWICKYFIKKREEILWKLFCSCNKKFRMRRLNRTMRNGK